MSILKITDNQANDESLNVIKITINEFCDIHNHPWIASAGFDFVVVDLDKRIPHGALSAMMGKIMIVPKIIGDINSSTVSLLAEIYPDIAAKLRFTFVRNRGDISDIIADLSEKYEWEYYYNLS